MFRVNIVYKVYSPLHLYTVENNTTETFQLWFLLNQNTLLWRVDGIIPSSDVSLD